MKMRVFLRALVLSLFSFIFLGCGKGENSAPGVFVVTVPVEGASIKGPEGVSINIPPGALAEETEITITTADINIPDVDELGPIFELKPLNLELLKPADIVIPFEAPKETQPDTLQIFWAQHSTDDYTGMETTVDSINIPKALVKKASDTMTGTLKTQFTKLGYFALGQRISADTETEGDTATDVDSETETFPDSETETVSDSETESATDSETVTDTGTGEVCITDLPMTVRDFSSQHSDFSSVETLDNATVAIMGTNLDASQRPQAGDSAPATFGDWFTTTADVNFEFSKVLPLTTGAGTLEYTATHFFPLAMDEGYGYEGYYSTLDSEANILFTAEINAQFTYNGGETITLGTTDDSWLFIENTLVLDQGGPHLFLSNTVNLDDYASTMDLQPGNTYALHLFLASRSQLDPQLTFKTTISCLSQP